MTDRLTQLQDAVDQLANQFVASIFYIHKHHDLQPLSTTDIVRQEKKEDGEPSREGEVDPLPAEAFRAGQVELARDLIIREQQIELLISKLPGLENSENDQERLIQQLEDELKMAEQERKEAQKEKEVVLARLEGVIRSVKRP